MIRIILFFWLMLHSLTGFTQMVIQAGVLDKETRQPLSFCGIRSKASGKSCISNEDGVFRLTGLPEKDSIMISYLGYKTRTLSVGWFKTHTTVYLEKSGIVIDEFVIHAGDDYLFEILANCRQKLRSAKQHPSKMYFTLETTYNNQAVEMLESYNNCLVSNCCTEDIHLKNGRIGLAMTDDNSYFVSLNTSQAVSYINITESNAYLPDIPLQFSRNKMKKNFKLTRLTTAEDQQNSVHIGFSPIENDGKAFRGELWIHKTSFGIQKIILEGDQLRTHPFLPMFPGTAVDSVGIKIVLNYDPEIPGGCLSNISFNYSLIFSKSENKRSIQTKGLMYFYDYDNPFILPYFDFDPSQNDYRKITFMPYNPSFWSNSEGLMYTEKQDEMISFLRKNGVLLNYNHHIINDIPVNEFIKLKAKFFEDNYVWWSDTSRLSLKNNRLNKDTLTAQQIYNPKLRSELSKLRAQIFLDIYPVGDSLSWFSATVFDVFNSFYKLEEINTTDCFLNIYFDLCEIERRKMEKQLSLLRSPDRAAIESVYQQTLASIDSLYDIYRKKVQTGFNQTELRKYNDHVFKETGIDNFKIFRVDETPANP